MRRPEPRITDLPLGPLRTYTRDEAGIWNAFCRAFPDVDDWEQWLDSVFSKALARPAGKRLSLTQSSRAQASTVEHRLEKAEVRLGRAPDNDVLLAGASISKHHARIFLRDESFYLEDLGGALGSYLNQKKISPHEPVALKEGDEIVIFPYTLAVRIESMWAPESGLQLRLGNPSPARLESFLDHTPVGYESYHIGILPTDSHAVLQLDARLVQTLLERSLMPVGLRSPAGPDSSAGLGVLELLLLAVLRNLNTRVAFPFQFSLNRVHPQSITRTQGRGISASLCLGLTDASGAGRIFLTYDALGRISELCSSLGEPQLPAAIQWSFPVAAGRVMLTVDDIRQLERDDVVMFDDLPELLFPKDFSRGWNITLKQDADHGAVVGNYFERKFTMAAQTTENPDAGGADRPDLGGLAVLLHVIVAEKELTLNEANGLVAGTILDLDRDMSSTVRLAVNGRTVGEGELVDVDGKLGVRIVKWGTP